MARKFSMVGYVYPEMFGGMERLVCSLTHFCIESDDLLGSQGNYCQEHYVLIIGLKARDSKPIIVDIK